MKNLEYGGLFIIFMYNLKYIKIKNRGKRY